LVIGKVEMIKTESLSQQIGLDDESLLFWLIALNNPSTRHSVRQGLIAREDDVLGK